MSPLPSGFIAPAQLVKNIGDNQATIGNEGIILSPHAPIIESDISADPFAFSAGITFTRTFTGVLGPLSEFEILRTDFGNPPAGHLLVCCFGSGGYLGESLMAVRNVVDNLGWEGPNNVAAQGFASDTGEITCRVTARVSTGDDFDSAVLFSAGQFPSYFSITDFGLINGAEAWTQGQNMWTTNANLQSLNALPMIQSQLFQGAWPQYTLSIFSSVKRAQPSAGETSSGPVPLGQGITTNMLGTVDGVFDRGLIFASGWKMTGLNFQNPPVQVDVDDWMPTIGFVGDSWGVSIKYNSTYSFFLPNPPL